MAYDTVILQGRFTSTGANQTIQLRSDVDWMKVYNTTIAANNQTTAVGVEFYWQRGFPAGSEWMYLKSNAANAANLSQFLTTGGFTLVDSSANPNAALNNGSTGISAISNANPPVVTVGSTTGMAPGNVVRIYNVVGAQQLGGFDFTVGYGTFSGTTFSLDYMSAIAAAAAPGANASFRVINFDPIFYPRRRYITKITQASQAVVSLSVTHGYQVGQLVRFVVPAAFGMVEMDGLQGTIVAINTATTAVTGNTITVNIDSSSFTAFAWPLTNAVPFTAAEVVPIGEDTSQALLSNVDILSDATINTGYIGMILAGGANLPGGANGNVMYWVAGKSFSVNNQ
jgi:hypothetical protein